MGSQVKVFPNHVDEGRQERMVVINHDGNEIGRVFPISIQAGIFAERAIRQGAVCIIDQFQATGSRQIGIALIAGGTQGHFDVTSLGEIGCHFRVVPDIPGDGVLKNQTNAIARSNGANRIHARAHKLVFSARSIAGFSAYIRPIHAECGIVLVGDGIAQRLPGHILDG